MTVILGKVCTICQARGELVAAVNVAQNAGGLQWYECTAHGAGDHSKEFGTGLDRTRVESAEAWFKRYFPQPKGRS
jgi:hypothetical protein